VQERLWNWILRGYIHSWAIFDDFHNDGYDDQSTSRVHEPDEPGLGREWLWCHDPDPGL